MSSLELTKEEQEALDGKKGDAIASAYRILLAIGNATGADRLVPVEWAHVSGVNYNTIGDAGVEFLENFSEGAKVAIRTTVNPMGFDRDNPGDLPQQFIEKQTSIASSYRRMGVTPSFTCTPYEVFDIPRRGAAVSFAESNAAVFANSILGLATNKESALSALASAVTGKAPLSDLRIDKFRQPQVAIELEPGLEPRTELDYGILGYFTGKAVNESCAAIHGISEDLPTPAAKAISAGIGTSGSCGMFTAKDDKKVKVKDRIAFGKREAASVMDELNTAEDGDIVAFGSPQLGMAELSSLASAVKGRKFTKRCIIFCSRAIHAQASKAGLVDRIEGAGGEFMRDCCMCLTPLITKEKFDAVITNSVKGAYYMNNSNKVKVALKDTKTIVDTCAR
jgi:predicted aconitase